MNMNEKEIIELVHSTKSIIYNKELAHAVTVKGAADYVTKVDVAVDGVENPVRFFRIQVTIFLLFCKENDVRCPGSQFFS